MRQSADHKELFCSLIMRVWLRALLLAAILPLSTSDVEVLRADGSGRVATVVQDSAVGWDTTIYPHCVFVDNPQFAAIDTDSSQTLSRTELNNDGASVHHRTFSTLYCSCTPSSLATGVVGWTDAACLPRRWQPDIHNGPGRQRLGGRAGIRVGR